MVIDGWDEETESYIDPKIRCIDFDPKYIYTLEQYDIYKMYEDGAAIFGDEEKEHVEYLEKQMRKKRKNKWKKSNKRRRRNRESLLPKLPKDFTNSELKAMYNDIKKVETYIHTATTDERQAMSKEEKHGIIKEYYLNNRLNQQFWYFIQRIYHDKEHSKINDEKMFRKVRDEKTLAHYVKIYEMFDSDGFKTETARSKAMLKEYNRLVGKGLIEGEEDVGKRGFIYFIGMKEDAKNLVYTHVDT